MAIHRFKLGDLVELKRTSRFQATPGPYEIVQLLLAVHGEPKYRIRVQYERIERIVMESELERYSEIERYGDKDFD